MYFVPFWEWKDWTLTFVIHFEELNKVLKKAQQKELDSADPFKQMENGGKETTDQTDVKKKDNKKKEVKEPVVVCPLIILFDETFADDMKSKKLKIGIDCETRQILVLYSDNKEQSKKSKNDKGAVDQILIRSQMKIQPQSWYRIYLTRHGVTKLELYVNGFLEGVSQVSLSSVWKHLTVGYLNEHEEGMRKCPPSFQLDALKLYTRSTQSWEIIAASEQFQQYVDWVKLNCVDCALGKSQSCEGGFHLCSSLELYSFAINVARNMGWGNQANFWSSDTNIDTVKKDDLGIGLCCRDIEYI